MKLRKLIKKIIQISAINISISRNNISGYQSSSFFNSKDLQHPTNFDGLHLQNVIQISRHGNRAST